MGRNERLNEKTKWVVKAVRAALKRYPDTLEIEVGFRDPYTGAAKTATLSGIVSVIPEGEHPKVLLLADATEDGSTTPPTNAAGQPPLRVIEGGRSQSFAEAELEAHALLKENVTDPEEHETWCDSIGMGIIVGSGGRKYCNCTGPVPESGLDVPTSHRLCREGGLEHRESCSSTISASMLCDCGAVYREWQRRVDVQRESRMTYDEDFNPEDSEEAFSPVPDAEDEDAE